MNNYGALLSPQEHEKWVSELIIPTFTKGRNPSENPTFVLITGQPGSGKSYSSRHYAKENLDISPVVFGADDIRALHPMSDKILKSDHANYPFITKYDAGLARAKLLNYCFDKGYNIVVESILSNETDYKMQTLLDARDHKYNVECLALGVHRHVSEVSIFYRQETQISSTKEIGFPATPEMHDHTYRILPNILANMNDYGTVDKISICNRKYDYFYDSNKDPHDPVLIRQKLQESRNSYLNKDEMLNVAVRWQEVLRMMNNRQAPQKDIDQVQELYSKFMKNSGLSLSSDFRKYSQNIKDGR